MEKIFINDLIIRPGLVIGNGGLFKKISSQLKKNKITPLINNGNQMLYTIGLDDLSESLIKCISNSLKGVLNIAHNQTISFRELIRLIGQKNSLRPILIPVPLIIIKVILFTLIIIKKSLFSFDNLQGLLTAKSIDTTFEMKALNVNWKSAKNVIENLH
jgi:NAD dependent epimerase/dehydratase family enzyme